MFLVLWLSPSFRSKLFLRSTYYNHLSQCYGGGYTSFNNFFPRFIKREVTFLFCLHFLGSEIIEFSRLTNVKEAFERCTSAQSRLLVRSLFIGETTENRKRNNVNRPLFDIYGKYKVGIDYI